MEPKSTEISIPLTNTHVLHTLYSDVIWEYIKTDSIIQMFGARSFRNLKRKKDKVQEMRKYVLGYMWLVARVYIAFQEIHGKQKEVQLDNKLNNAADMWEGRHSDNDSSNK